MTEEKPAEATVREEQTANKNFEALEKAFGEQSPTPVNEAPKPEEAKPEEQKPEEDNNPFKPEEQKLEDQKPEEKKPEEEGEKPKDEKPEEQKPITDEDLFKVDESVAVENSDEPTWKSVLVERGYEVPENFSEEKGLEVLLELEEKKANERIEEARSLTVDKLLSTLKPEVAASIKLMEMGVPQEQILNPTREIDQYLAMSEVEIVRADLEKQGYPEDLVDAKLEALSTSPEALKRQADLIKFELTQAKTAILDQRNQLIQQFETKAQEASLMAKEAEKTQFKQALNTVEDFLGKSVPKAAKDKLYEEFSKGRFDKDFNDPKAKVELAMYKLFGKSFASSLKNTAFEQGREKIVKELTNVPPVNTSGSGSFKPKPPESESDANWEPLAKAFGGG